MPSFRTIVAAAVLLGLAAVAAAQPPAAPQLREFTQGNPGFMRFRLAEGRLVLTCRSPGGLRSQRNFGSQQQETISLGTENGRPNLNYARTTATEQLSVNISASGDVRITRAPLGTGSVVSVDFHQAPNEKTTFVLGAGEHRQVFVATDFWRLAIAQPKECREHLIPLLDLLRPDWKLATAVGDVETKLLALAGDDATADHARWTELVKQLGDDHFAKREAADRALRTGGAAALGYLRQLDFNHLDAEQQFRVRHIIDALAGRSEDDSSDAIAASLARDPAVWLALLGRPEAATRQTAARQLAKLLGDPIDIDPAAEPDSQKAKRELLRARIEKK